MKRMIVIMLLMSVLGISVLIDRKLARQDDRYQALVDTYECVRAPCMADFNGNGRPERFEVVGADRGDSWLRVVDGERELFRYPFVNIDGTLRTHLAVRTDADGPRLLIFDGTSGQGNHYGVYTWTGERMAQVAPATLDREILAAMAARDDAGTFHQWVLYRHIRDTYFSLLTIITVGVVLFCGLQTLIPRIRLNR